MMLDQKHVLISAGAIISVGIIAVAALSISPKAETSEQDATDPLDMTIPDMSKPSVAPKKTKHGCVMPPRPDWAVDAPIEDINKVSLLLGIYDVQRKQAIIEKNDCSCETEYPSWKAAEVEYNRLIKGLTDQEILELDYTYSDKKTALNRKAREICRNIRGN